MAHFRKRHLFNLLKSLTGLSPIVGVIGHRQVGKTTLVEQLCKHYYTFDDAQELIEARSNAADYIEKRAGRLVAIDECQIVESLFPALKEWVRKHKQPGQYILTGSVRFTSRKAIQESLTGRIITLELLPFLASELHKETLSSFWRDNLVLSHFSETSVQRYAKKRFRFDLDKYFESGGLPGICFIRNSKFRGRKLEAQIETILDRDLRKILSTEISYPQLRLLAQVLANLQGEELSWTKLRQETQVSIPTLKKLLYALEAIFLFRPVLTEGDSRGVVYYFEDLAEVTHLRTLPQTKIQQLTHFLMLHIRGELSYGLSEPFRIFQYRSRAGVVVPIVIEVKNEFLAVIPIENESPSRIERAASESFLKRYNHSKVIFIRESGKAKFLDSRRMVVPVSATV
ncbi:MAG: hypothetical protein FJZ63_07660 [Chlamydiae bacterium]|nr:hypothetical protein [Chlamydiota bacterium]